VLEGINKKLILIVLNPFRGYSSMAPFEHQKQIDEFKEERHPPPPPRGGRKKKKKKRGKNFFFFFFFFNHANFVL